MANKLMMSRKEECDNYNLITETIDKLVDMCDNAEAIALRDELFDLFITKYSEPLYNILGLQEELGCPLDVVVKALTQEIWYEGNRGYLYLMKCNGLKFLNGWCITNGLHYANTKDYKKTWWLREDRSK